MDDKDIKYLRDLSERATTAHVIGYGSAEVVIYAAEFYALEEAIKTLSKKEGGNQ